MRTVEIYEACDGKRFESRKDCMFHEETKMVAAILERHKQHNLRLDDLMGLLYTPISEQTLLIDELYYASKARREAGY